MAQASRPCKGCGELIYRTAAVAPIRHYCSPDCRPRCSVDGCENPRHGLTYCSSHLYRWKRYGDPLAPKVRGRNEGECSLEYCDQPMRKRGWCASHYAQWYTTGSVAPFKHKWAPEKACVICGARDWDGPRRQVCSGRCQQILVRYGGPPPDPSCARCGVVIALTGSGVRRKRADTKLCRRCRMHHRTEATPLELAQRDGPWCQLCGCDVDMTAVFPDPMRASVDHVVPRALGGSDAADNNQLAHLRCNQIKSDRLNPADWGLLP